MSKKKFKCAKNGSNEQQTNCSNEQKNSSNEQKIVSYEPIKSCGHMTNNINYWSCGRSVWLPSLS